MGSRLAAYRALLREIRSCGYRFCTIIEFAEIDRSAAFDQPVCLLRNDVDSNKTGVAQMFGCDRDEGVRATYFFRLSTIDRKLMDRIENHVGVVGYHFEEIASVAKRLGLNSRAQVDAHMEEIRDEFRRNIAQFHERTGRIPLAVASHGDFVNRRIGVSNSDLLTPALMEELGIVADAYGDRFHRALDARFSDFPPPQWWKPFDPVQVLPDRPRSLSILVHPRQWTCNPALNLWLNGQRISQEISWRRRAAMTERRNARGPTNADNP